MAAARGGGAWDSALSVNEFAAIRAVGFEPVGQVFGAAVYYLATVAGVSCPGTTAAGYPLPGAAPGAAEPSGSLVTGFPGTAARLAQALYEGRRTAIDRMAGECADLGGHGIVGAVLRVAEIPATSFTAAAIEFTVTGTAVRGGGCPPLARPFAADLSGPDFAKLIRAGCDAGRDRARHLGRRAARRPGDDQFRPVGHGERGSAGLHRPDDPGAAGCARSPGAVGARAWRRRRRRVRHDLARPQRSLPRSCGRRGSFRRGGHRRQRGCAIRRPGRGDPAAKPHCRASRRRPRCPHIGNRVCSRKATASRTLPAGPAATRSPPRTSGRACAAAARSSSGCSPRSRLISRQAASSVAILTAVSAR